jgi:hypothetical protein
MTYAEIKQTKEKATNDLFTACGVFWAFSNEQFKDGLAKTTLAEGEKVVDIGAGGFVPKSNVDKLINGMKEIDDTFKTQIADTKMREKHILYELNNHEAFYTGHISDALGALGEDYTAEEVTEVYKKFKAQRFVRK